MSVPQTIRLQPPQNIRLSQGNFFVEKLIGEGGFGNVYKSSFNGNEYALKLNRLWELHPQARSEIKKRIYQEFVISKTINSDHLVNSHGYEELEGNPLIIYDFCEGGSLKDRISKDFSSQYYKDVATQILEGLKVLHQNDIIHRDLKPENILFRQEKVVLTDFGISANLKRRLTQVNKRGYVQQIFASVCYSAPEQADKTLAYNTTGPNNDVFSFGVMMYEWFTHGKMPFGSVTEFQHNPNLYEERKKSGSWNMKLLQTKIPDPCWYSIVARCLEPDPRNRFQEVNEILQQLMYNQTPPPKPASQTPVVSSSKSPPIIAEHQLTWKMQIIEGLDKGKEFNLSNLAKYKNKRLLKIGRLDPANPQGNDIYLNETGGSYISRNHATIEMTFDSKGKVVWIIRDGQWCLRNGRSGWYISRNGIIVNEKKVEGDIQLKTNDIVQIGKIKLLVFCF